ncbi:MAG: tetratricopeptide repeat protein [Candidatus Adlerbacteria bacterium]|nr:tetratricopeptide repeat protein [Candidatus Adlerbacteria bacterium]
MSWSRWLYLAGIVSALVLFIPTTWFPFQLGKLAIFAALLSLAVIFFTAGGGVRELLKAHGLRLALLVALLPLTYLLSWYFSQNPAVGITGFGIETDTVIFTTLGFLAFLLSFVLFRTLRTAYLLTQVVFWGLVAAAVFQLLAIIFGTGLLPFEAFTDRSVNLIGKWNDLGLIVGLLVLMSLTMLEFASLSPARFIGLAGLLAVFAFLLGIINFTLVWGLILGFSLALALVKFISQKVPRGESQDPYAVPLAPGVATSRIPWYALAASAMAVVFLFFGTSFNTAVTSIFPVSSFEVRPSYTSTFDVTNAAREGSLSELLIGRGPNTFSDVWLQYKPVEVNQTPFWSFDFSVGFSTLLTALGSVGFLGVVVWMIPFFLVLAALLRVIRLNILSREERVIATTIGAGALFLFATLILYVPSQNIILLALTLCGASFGFLWRQGRSSAENASEPSRLSKLLAGLFALVLILASLWSAGVIGRRTVSASFVQSSAAALAAGEYDIARQRAARARGIEETPDTLRISVNAGSLKLEQLAGTEVTAENTATLQAEFTSLMQETIDLGQRLVAMSDYDYRSHFSLARVYDLLTVLGVQGALESARASYTAAAERNPTNPAISLALARLAASQNDLAGAEANIMQALTLKPNYTDAMLFVVQLNVARNDLPKAIDAALAAAQSAPGVAPIWFQLGLLLYSGGDTTNAIAAFEQAITLVPDYANAKYFLGLAYAAVGRTDESIRQFEDIQRTNPENAEIQIILGNLRLGKQPFEGVEPPPTPPEERAEAPVSE